MLNIPQMEMTEINGANFELFDGGNPDGEPLVYVHGGGSIEFQPATREPLLADQFRLIYIHRRGYGRSDVPDFPMTIGKYAEDNYELLRKLNLDQAHFASESSGGVTLLQYALDYPETVLTLTVMEPPIPQVIGEDPEFISLMEKSDARYRQGDREGAVEAFLEGVAGDDFREQFDASFPDGWLEQMANDIDAITQVEAPAMEAWSFGQNDAAKIERPVLNIGGANSRPFLRRCHEAIKSWFPQAENVLLPNTTHAMVETNPRGVAEHLAGFISRHPIN